MGLALGEGELRGAGEANGSSDVFGVRSAPAILGATVHQRLEMNSATNEKRTDSFRRAELVPRNGKEIELLLLRVDGGFAECLYGVGMHECAMFLGFAGELGDGLDRSNLVVDPHHRADCDVVIDELIERRRVHYSVRGHGEEALFRSFVCCLMNRAKDRLMLDRRRHDSLPTLRPERTPGAQDREIVGTGTARCGTDLVLLCSWPSAD